MNVEQRIESFFTYVCGICAMGAAYFIKEMAFLTECLQFGMALIGFIMVAIRFVYDTKLRRRRKPLPFNAND